MADNLPALVQALPTELYDEISELTFTAHTGPHTIDEKYKPSHLLRVNRASREDFAESYYGRKDTIFYIPMDLLMAFLRSLPKTHCSQIVEFRILDAVILHDAHLADIIRIRGFAYDLVGLVTHFNQAAGDNLFKVKLVASDGTERWDGCPPGTMARLAEMEQQDREQYERAATFWEKIHHQSLGAD